MSSNPQFLSIFDLAHHWHDVSVPVEQGPLPPRVRDMVTSPLQAILNSDIGLYEPIVVHCNPAGPVDQTGVHMLRHDVLPSEFEDMFLSGSYDAKVLAAYRLDIDDVFWWAATRGADDIPAFCISERFRGEPGPHNSHAKSRPEAEVKRDCQEMAKRIWADHPHIRIAEMARSREIQIDASGAQYQPITVVGWLREVAPVSVRNRPGRPPKRTGEES